jgi:hypothetical protein
MAKNISGVMAIIPYFASGRKKLQIYIGCVCTSAIGLGCRMIGRDGVCTFFGRVPSTIDFKVIPW